MMTCVAPVSSKGSRDTALPSLVRRVWEYMMRRGWGCRGGASGEEDEDGSASGRFDGVGGIMDILSFN